jgi:hypothetical protein
MPQLTVPRLSVPFIEGTFRTLGEQMKAHLAASLSYWWSLIDLIETFYLLHRSVALPQRHRVAQMGILLQRTLARVERLDPGQFVQGLCQEAPPSPQLRQQIFALIDLVESVLYQVTEMEDLKESIFAQLGEEQGVDVTYMPNPSVRGASFTNIVVALSLSRDNLQYELDPSWMWDSEPSTPSSEANNEEAVSFLVNMLIEEATEGIEPRRPSARIAANGRAIRALNRNFSRSYPRRRR